MLTQVLGGQVLQLPRGQRGHVPAARRVALVRLRPRHESGQQRQGDGLPLAVDLHAHHGPAATVLLQQRRQQRGIGLAPELPWLHLRDVAAAAAAQLGGLASGWSGKTVESTYTNKPNKPSKTYFRCENRLRMAI